MTARGAVVGPVSVGPCLQVGACMGRPCVAHLKATLYMRVQHLVGALCKVVIFIEFRRKV